ncbi:hypothetical protein RS9916_28659 [Synechococcus sp. RS9916]|nr:hypothetical protein RS9916_28659 [Synechococcus sp. RS9916]
MPNPKQLKRPLVHRVIAMPCGFFCFCFKPKVCKRFNAHSITAETIGTELIAVLQECKSHSFSLFAWAVHPSNSLKNVQLQALGVVAAVD